MALCPEVWTKHSRHCAVFHCTCSRIRGACLKNLMHNWWHEYDEDLTKKQLVAYMVAHPTVVKFNWYARATIKALPADMAHLFGTPAQAPAGSENKSGWTRSCVLCSALV